MWLLYIIIGAVALGVFLLGNFLLSSKKKIRRLSQSLSMSLFLVKMPKYEKKDEKEKQLDVKSLIESMEQVLAHFLYLKKPNFFEKTFLGVRPPRIVFEVASTVGGEDISFYIAVPEYMSSSAEKSIQGVYPDAVVEKVPEDYTVFEANGVVSASIMSLRRSFYFPVKTYKYLERDPLSVVTNALSKITPEEGSAIQVVVQPSSLDMKRKEEKILSAIIEKGKNPRAAVEELQGGKMTRFISNMIWGMLNSTQKKTKDEKDKQKQQEQQKEGTANQVIIDAIKAKAQKPVFDVNIRLMAVGVDKIRSTEILSHLESAFSQFSSSLNSFESNRVRKSRIKKIVYDFSFRNFVLRDNMVLNAEELTSVFHFPLPHIDSPNIQWSKTREVAPPTELPLKGINKIGDAVFRGETKPVSFASKGDRRRHFYIVGQTGTGKSSLIREMIKQDIEAGEGVGVIDPNGDLIEDTIANIPKSRAEDVVLFEPFDTDRPGGLNMLEWTAPEQKDFAISEMITIFSKLFPPEVIGPMFEHYMRNAMLALMADKENPGTLVEIPRMFTDDEFMKEKVSKVVDPIVRSFWLKEWAKTTGQSRSDMLGYVVSKVGRFIENTMVRNIIGQTKSGFDLGDIMDNKKIFLANLSKGQTGEMNSSLLGLILVSKMQIAAFRRAGMPEDQRKDFYLYIDEFQNFTTDSIATILSEARKYRLNLILAHQFMPQLTDEIRNAVIGNVGNMASYRVGANDAEVLEKQFEPEFSSNDLLNVDNFHFICKMMINNNVSTPFKVKAMKPTDGNKEIVPSIKKLSKLKYTRPRALVEQEILERSRLGA